MSLSFLEDRISEIQPNLWISEYIVRQYPDFLKSKGIKLVIDFTKPEQVPSAPNYQEIRYVRLSIDDHELLENRPCLIEQFFKEMEYAKESGVLLHCISGGNRSPAMAILWMMRNGMIFQDAYRKVEKTRGTDLKKIYGVNISITHQLMDFLIRQEKTT